MNIPGSNVLGMCLSLIAPQAVKWYRSIGRIQNDLGEWVASYDTPVVLRGSFQPIDKAKYEALGLDLTQHYAVFYVSKRIKQVERQSSGDLLEYCGRKYQTLDGANWMEQDGWIGIMCVDVGVA